MPIIPGTGVVIEVVQRGLIAASGSSSKPTANLWHFRRTTTTQPATKANISAAFQTAIGDTVAAALNAGWSATFNDIRFLQDATDPYASFTQTAVGGIAGDRMASYVTAFILGRTGLRGRRYRTNKKIGPMSESDTTTASSDVWNAGALTRLGAIATAWISPWTDSDGNTWLPLAVSGPPLSQLKVDPTTLFASDLAQVLVNHRVGTLISRKSKSVY